MRYEIGDRVIIKEIDPPVYPLRHGLKPGDIVKILSCDTNSYFDVERESDGQRSRIYSVNIDRRC